MLLIVGTVRLPAENLHHARGAMRSMVEASRAENGCREYCHAEDILDPGLVHIKEIWEDHVVLERHFASDHIATWRSSWPVLGIGDRNLELYEVGTPKAI